jgi:hypothetical protein
MPRAGFEPAIPATKLPQTYALDREATGIGHLIHEVPVYNFSNADSPKATLSRNGLLRSNICDIFNKWFNGEMLHYNNNELISKECRLW